MPRRPFNSVKLGAFVIAGLAFLILMLYTIGKNKNLFGSTFLLKAHFSNANGLTAGNNVRFSGIDAGTVKSVAVLNDTTIEVTLSLKDELRPYIRKNCVASIGTDGVMGNKLLNLTPASGAAPPVAEGDVLAARREAGTDDVIAVLYATATDLSEATKAVRSTTERINRSEAMWRLLEDKSIPERISVSLKRVATASGHLEGLMANLRSIGSDVSEGKGSLGALLRDTALAAGLLASERKLQAVLTRADSLLLVAQQLTSATGQQLQQGKGAVPVLLNDPELARRLDRTLSNLEGGTEAFEQSMVALQHNFLLRGYFRRQEAKKKAALPDTAQR